MKKFLIGVAFVCLISLGWTCVYGKEIPYFREKVEIPPEIAKAAIVSEVRVYLENSDEVTRIAAARRLGQLGDPNAVNILALQFAKEPYQAASQPGIEALLQTKMNAIRQQRPDPTSDAAIAKMYGVKLLPYLEPYRNDTSERVRWQALQK